VTQLTTGWGDPEREKGEHGCGWLHVPPRKHLTVAVLSTAPCRYRGHWIDGGMRPCTGDQCVYCDRRMGGQWRYAFHVQDTEGGGCGFFEVGAATAEVIWRIASAQGELRGLCFRFEHEGGREKGRVTATQVVSSVPDGMLAEEQDPGPHIRRGWTK